MKFVNIALSCMFVAQITLGAYLVLKKNNVAAGLMVPLAVFQVLFHIYIQQRHFHVASRLATEDSVRLDAEGPTDFSFLTDKYKQSALKVKELQPDYPSESEGVAEIEGDEIDSVQSSPPADGNIDEEHAGWTTVEKESLTS